MSINSAYCQMVLSPRVRADLRKTQKTDEKFQTVNLAMGWGWGGGGY